MHSSKQQRHAAACRYIAVRLHCQAARASVLQQPHALVERVHSVLQQPHALVETRHSVLQQQQLPVPQSVLFALFIRLLPALLVLHAECLIEGLLLRGRLLKRLQRMLT